MDPKTVQAQSAAGVGSSEFGYEGKGRRVYIIEKNSAGSVTASRYFVWDGLKIAEERATPNGPPVKIFTDYGEIRGGQKYYYTKDHLGSVREVLNSNGTVVARYDYDPYGVPTKLQGSMNFDFLFTGHFYHAPTGLYLAPYRAYNPGLGKWLSREPLGLDGPNLYHYGFNDPLNVVDPTGLYSFKSVPSTQASRRQLQRAIARLRGKIRANNCLRSYFSEMGMDLYDMLDYNPGSFPIINYQERRHLQPGDVGSRYFKYSNSITVYATVGSPDVGFSDFELYLMHELGNYAADEGTGEANLNRYFTYSGEQSVINNESSRQDGHPYGTGAEFLIEPNFSGKRSK